MGWFYIAARDDHKCDTPTLEKIPDEVKTGDIWLCPWCRMKWRIWLTPGYTDADTKIRWTLIDG